MPRTSIVFFGIDLMRAGLDSSKPAAALFQFASVGAFGTNCWLNLSFPFISFHFISHFGGANEAYFTSWLFCFCIVLQLLWLVSIHVIDCIFFLPNELNYEEHLMICERSWRVLLKPFLQSGYLTANLRRLNETKYFFILFLIFFS